MHGQVDRRDGGGAVALRATGRRPRGVRWRLALTTLLALVLIACEAGGSSDEGLTLFAAASLREVSAELEAAWAETEPDVPLTIATEASNVLAAQIAEGARADVFISADHLQTQRLAEDGLTAAPPFTFAGNEVALVARPDGPVREAGDLAAAGTIVIVGGPGTPIGRYTERALDALAAEMSDPDQFAAAVEANVASREDNVRAALAKVELGEGDAAFVYRTDALGSTDTLEIELPAAARVDAPFSAVLLRESERAAAFVEWLGGPTVRAILTGAGFEAIS